MGFHLLRRAGYHEDFIDEVARVMEYQDAYKLYSGVLETVSTASSQTSVP